MAPQQQNAEIVRVTLENGAEGTASTFSGSSERAAGVVVSEVAALTDRVVGCDVTKRTALTETLLAGAGAGPWHAISNLDCAMWAAYANSIGQPLYQLLGHHQNRIPAQASIDAFDTLKQYLDITERAIELGYTAVKLHMSTHPDFDIELIKTLSKRYKDGRVRFMTDHEQQHSYDEAVRIGRTMGKGPFDWFEAPLPDTDIDAYAELNRAVDIDIIPAGNTVVGLENWRAALQRNAWSRLRFDVTNAGGITTAIKAMHLAQSMNVPAELQSYAFGPGQQLNLHVMLGISGCSWFEHPFPSERYDYPVNNPVVLEADGCIKASLETGLGIDIDWDGVEANAVATFDSLA